MTEQDETNLILLAALVGGYFLFKKKKDNTADTEAPTVTQVEPQKAVSLPTNTVTVNKPVTQSAIAPTQIKPAPVTVPIATPVYVVAPPVQPIIQQPVKVVMPVIKTSAPATSLAVQKPFVKNTYGIAKADAITDYQNAMQMMAGMGMV